MSEKKGKINPSKSVSDVLYSTVGSLFVFDMESNRFIQVEKDCIISLESLSSGPKKTISYLTVLNGNENIIARCVVDLDINPDFNSSGNKFLFNTDSINHHALKPIPGRFFVENADKTNVCCLAILFNSNKEYTDFSRNVIKCIVLETVNINIDDIDQNEAVGLERRFGLERMDVDNLEDVKKDKNNIAVKKEATESDDEYGDLDDYEYVEAINKYEQNNNELEEESDEEESEEESEEEESEEEYTSKSKPTGNRTSSTTKNTGQTISYCGDNTYVSRGNIVDVFKYDNVDKSMIKRTSFDTKDIGGSSFNPKKMILRENESKLLMIDELSDRLIDLDLNSNKVVKEYSYDNTKFNDVFGVNRYSQMTGEQTFIGVGNNSFFSIDPRAPESFTDKTQYSTINDFTSGNTSLNGELAIGNAKGEIRLYNTMGLKRAKTTLPAQGSGIISIDISNNGEYLLMTYSDHLELIQVKVEHNGQAVNFFTKSVNDAKPKPIRLRLHPNHRQWIGPKAQFNPAKFDAGDSIENNYVVSSIGEYVISWKLKDAISGSNKYTLRKFANNKVVLDGFRYKNIKDIVVTSEDNTEIVNVSKLLPPKQAFNE